VPVARVVRHTSLTFYVVGWTRRAYAFQPDLILGSTKRSNAQHYLLACVLKQPSRLLAKTHVRGGGYGLHRSRIVAEFSAARLNVKNFLRPCEILRSFWTGIRHSSHVQCECCVIVRKDFRRA